AVLWETRKRAWKRLGATFGHGVERPRDGHPLPAPKQAPDANSLDVSELARFPSGWARGTRLSFRSGVMGFAVGARVQAADFNPLAFSGVSRRDEVSLRARRA